MSLADTLAAWLPPSMASEPRTPDSRLTGIRLPYDIATARRIYERGPPEPTRHLWRDFSRSVCYRHAEAVVIAHDRDRLISTARD